MSYTRSDFHEAFIEASEAPSGDNMAAPVSLSTPSANLKEATAAAVAADYTAILSGSSWWGSYTSPPGKATFITYSFEDILPATYSYSAANPGTLYATFQAYPLSSRDAVRCARFTGMRPATARRWRHGHRMRRLTG